MHDRLEIGNEIGQTRLQSEHEGTGQPDPVESGSHAQRHEDDADQRCTTIRGHAKVALDNEIISGHLPSRKACLDRAKNRPCGNGRFWRKAAIPNIGCVRCRTCYEIEMISSV